MAFLCAGPNAWSQRLAANPPGQALPASIVLQTRQDLHDPERFFVTVHNSQPTTQTGTLSLDSVSEDGLAPEFSLGPGQARSFAFPLAPFWTWDPYGGFFPRSIHFYAYEKGPQPGSYVNLRDFIGSCPSWPRVYDLVYSLFPSQQMSLYSPFVDRSFLAGVKSPADCFVATPDGSAFPDDPAQLAWLDAIFLDGPAIGDWSEAQKQALEIWVAGGGLLFLDPPALNALGDSALACGVRADLASSRTIDLGLCRPAPLPPRPAAGPQSPPTARPSPRGAPGRPQAAGPASQPQTEAEPKPRRTEPVPVAAVQLRVPGWEPGGPKRPGAPPGLLALGEGPDLASWRFGAGIVSLQSFRGVGDELAMVYWIQMQHSRRLPGSMGLLPTSHVRDLAEGRGLTTDPGPQSQRPPRSFGEELGHLLSPLGRLLQRSASARRVLGGMGAFAALTFVLFFVLRLVRNRPWRRALVAQWAVLALAGAAIYWAGRTSQTRAGLFDMIVAAPQAPWRLRQITLALRSEGVGRVSAELAGRWPSCVAWSAAKTFRIDPKGNAKPLPLFTPGRAAPKPLWEPAKAAANGEEWASYVALVEPAKNPGLEADLQISTDSLRGAVRNASEFTLLDGVVYVARGDRIHLARLPSPFRPKQRTEIKPLGQSREGKATSARQPLPVGISLAAGQSLTVKSQDYVKVSPAGPLAPEIDVVLPSDVGFVWAWIEDSPALDDLFKITPPPAWVRWRRCYVQLLYLD